MNKKSLDLVQSSKILQVLKVYVGLGNYDFSVSSKKVKEGYAEIFVDEYDQLFKVDLDPDFFKMDYNKQYNILVHELIHGRLSLAQDRIKLYTDKIIFEEEEKCVNDVTALACHLLNP